MSEELKTIDQGGEGARAFLSSPRASGEWARGERAPRPDVIHDGFARSLFPYKDVCVVKLRNKKLASRIREICGRANLSLNYKRDYLIVGDVWNGDFVFSGYGKIGERAYWGEMASTPDFDGITLGSGGYEYFEFVEDGVRAANDYFGVSALFTYEDENFSLLTNRAHLAGIFAAVSDKRELNLPAIYVNIMCATYFREATNLNETAIKNLSRVPVKYFAKLTDRIRLIPVNETESDEDYEELVDKSIRETKDFYGSFRRLLPDFDFVFDLTAGKDTRMNISPFCHEVIKIRTDNLPDSPDTRVSLSIASIFPNMTYADECSGCLWPLSSEDGARAWLSYSFAFGDYLDITGSLAKYGTSTQIVCRGAYEIYRHYFAYAPKAFNRMGDWIASFLESDSSYFLKNLSPPEQEAAKDYILDDIERRFGHYERMDRALTDYYWFGTWRSHFGRGREELFTGELRMFPCLNQYGIQALKKLPEEEIGESRFIYDFIFRCSPPLANMEFDTPFPAADKERRFAPTPLPERFEKAKLEFENAISRYRAQAEAKLRGDKRGRGVDDWAYLHMRRPDAGIRAFLHEAITRAVVRISAVAPELASFCAKMYGIWNTEYDWLIKQSICQKLLLLDNCLLPLESMKSALDDEDSFLSLVMPIEDFEYKDNEIKLKVYDFLNPSEFLYGLRVFEGDKFFDYPFQFGRTFKIAQDRPTALGIRARRGRAEKAPAKYVQRKIARAD
ncbi:MAG: hypothetical protein K2H64_00225 [Desulfovibrio sp.]|nr:hypothetical protein [Desulfovibrio sp.]